MGKVPAGNPAELPAFAGNLPGCPTAGRGCPGAGLVAVIGRGDPMVGKGWKKKLPDGAGVGLPCDAMVGLGLGLGLGLATSTCCLGTGLGLGVAAKVVGLGVAASVVGLGLAARVGLGLAGCAARGLSGTAVAGRGEVGAGDGKVNGVKGEEGDGKEG